MEYYSEVLPLIIKADQIIKNLFFSVSGFLRISFHLFLLILYVINSSFRLPIFAKWVRASARFRSALAVRLRMAAVASATAYSQALC